MGIVKSWNTFFSRNGLGSVTYHSDPQKITAFPNGNECPVVYLSGKVISFPEINMSGQVICPYGFEDIYPLLTQGIEAPNSSCIVSDEKLKTAIDLYNAHFFEPSASARFLTLIMVLEVLNPKELKSGVVLDLLNKWEKEIETLKNQLEPETEEDDESLDALSRELIFRKEKSLRSQIRSLVYKTLEKDKNPKAKQLSKRAVYIYDKRGTLVHEGKLPPNVLDEVEREAKGIVEMVLKAKLRVIAGI